MSRVSPWGPLIASIVLAAACGDAAPPGPEADAGPDATLLDAGLRDLARPDAPGCMDEDGDGRAAASCGGDDCDDADPTRYPGAAEICDADDEDCDDTTFGADADDDGYESALCCNGVDNCGTDCDDALNTVNPGAAEQCNGGLDDDCDGLADAAEGVCVACPSGYSGFDGVCADIDECMTSEPCGAAVGATCANTDGSYACTCPTGYTGLATGGTCNDVDECALGAPCGPTATACANTVGSYSCSCAPGHAAPPTGDACANIDECALPTTCGGGRVGCTDTDGSYACTCRAGYSAPATGGICADINECDTGSPCGATATGCTNTIGTYICACAAGYSAPATGGTCADVDDCALATTCGAWRAGCSNVGGTYACTCLPGFTAPATGGTCGDIDECTAGTPCGTNGSACANIDGTYSCSCNTGYNAPATGGTCTDVDECELPTTCGSWRASCANVAGSYTCACQTGYGAPATGGTCTDVDECAASSTCGAARASCSNTTGSYVCTCQANYSAPASGGTCADLDECADSATCGAGRADCTNIPGSYACACQSGYSAPVSGGACADIDECATTATCGSARAGCANTVGSYVCACQGGYAPPPTGGACTDVDECANSSTCGGARAGCANTVGSYVCACQSGYVAPASGGTCIDVNECSANPCGTYATSCANLPSSYVCTCAAGYAAPPTGGSCTDVDECAFGSTCGSGRAGCVNTAGTYSCSCLSGYQAPATGGTCVDIDECVLGTDSCDHDPLACTNTVGAFSCGCPVGFAGTGAGAAGCLLTDPALSALLPSAGALSPVFAGATTLYTLALPPGTTSVTLTPSVAFPAHAVIRVDGVVVASGGASAAIVLAAFAAPVPVTVTVTTETGEVRSYSVVVSRGSTYIKASNTGSADMFGQALALSVDGSTLAIGTGNEDSNATGVNGDQANDTGTNSGAVYVFTRTSGVWSQQAYIKASNTGVSDNFGAAIDLSADGSTLAVGADGEDSITTGIDGNQANNLAPGAGAAYVFTRVGTTWSQQAYLKASNTATNAFFGCSVAVSDDGTVLAVGAVGEKSNATGVNGDQTSTAAGDAGAAYVFTRALTTWSQRAYVKASNTTWNDHFGTAVALSGDGRTLAVSAVLEDSSATGVGGSQTSEATVDSGAVYVFADAAGTWSQQAYVKASNTDLEDHFGNALALSADGSRMAVSASMEDSNATGINGLGSDNSAIDSGAVYVFVRAAAVWSQEAYVKASNTNANDQFGSALALSADGSTLACGAHQEASSATGTNGSQLDNTAAGAGAVYVVSRSGAVWTHRDYVKASNTSVADDFGGAVAISGDGSTRAVGAILEDSSATGIDGDQTSNGSGYSGAVYVY